MTSKILHMPLLAVFILLLMVVGLSLPATAEKVYPSVVFTPDIKPYISYIDTPIHGLVEVNVVLEEPLPEPAGTTDDVSWFTVVFPIPLGTNVNENSGPDQPVATISDCWASIDDKEPFYLTINSYNLSYEIAAKVPHYEIKDVKGRITTICSMSFMTPTGVTNALIPSAFSGPNNSYIPVVKDQSSYEFTIINPFIEFKRIKPENWSHQHVPPSVPIDDDYHEVNFSFHVGIIGYEVAINYGVAYPSSDPDDLETFVPFPDGSPFEFDYSKCPNHEDYFTFDWQFIPNIFNPDDTDSRRQLHITLTSTESFSCILGVRGRYIFDFKNPACKGENLDPEFHEQCNTPVVSVEHLTQSALPKLPPLTIFFLRTLESISQPGVSLLPESRGITIQYDSPACQSTDNLFKQSANCFEIVFPTDYDLSLLSNSNEHIELIVSGVPVSGWSPSSTPSIYQNILVDCASYETAKYHQVHYLSPVQSVRDLNVHFDAPFALFDHSSSSKLLLFPFYHDDVFDNPTPESETTYRPLNMISRDLLKTNSDGHYEIDFEVFLNGVPLTIDSGSPHILDPSEAGLALPPYSGIHLVERTADGELVEPTEVESYQTYYLELTLHAIGALFDPQLTLRISHPSIQFVPSNQILCDGDVTLNIIIGFNTDKTLTLSNPDRTVYDDFQCLIPLSFVGESTESSFITAQFSSTFTMGQILATLPPVKANPLEVGFLETRPLFLNQINFATIRVVGQIAHIEAINYNYQNIALRASIDNIRCTNEKNPNITSANYDEQSYKAVYTVSGGDNSIISLNFDEEDLPLIASHASLYGNTVSCPFLPLIVEKFGRPNDPLNGQGSQTTKVSTMLQYETQFSEFPSVYALSLHAQLAPAKVSTISFNMTSSIVGKHVISGPYPIDDILGPCIPDSPTSTSCSYECIHTDYSTPPPHLKQTIGTLKYYELYTPEGCADGDTTCMMKNAIVFDNNSNLSTVTNPLWCSFSASRRFSLSVNSLVAPISFDGLDESNLPPNKPKLSDYRVSALYPSISYLPPVFDMLFTTAEDRKAREYKGELTHPDVDVEADDDKYDLLSLDLYNIAATANTIFKITHFQPIDLSGRVTIPMICRDESLSREDSTTTITFIQLTSKTEASDRLIPGTTDQYEDDYILEFEFLDEVIQDRRHTCQAKIQYTAGTVKKPMTAIGNASFRRVDFYSYLNLPPVTSSYDFTFDSFDTTNNSLAFTIMNTGNDAPNNAIYVDFSSIGLPESVFECTQSEVDNPSIATSLAASFSRVAGYSLHIPLGQTSIATAYKIQCTYSFKSSSSTLPSGVQTSITAFLYEDKSGQHGVAKASIEYTSPVEVENVTTLVVHLQSYQRMESDLQSVQTKIGNIVALFLSPDDQSPSIHILRRAADISTVSFNGVTETNYEQFTPEIPEIFTIALVGSGYNADQLREKLSPTNPEFNDIVVFPLRPVTTPQASRPYPAHCFASNTHKCGVGCPIQCYITDACTIDADCESIFCYQGTCQSPVFTLDDYD